jgi:hypothetical protein
MSLSVLERAATLVHSDAEKSLSKYWITSIISNSHISK